MTLRASATATVVGFYTVRRWEPNLYERLGIRWFRKVVPVGDWTLRLIRRYRPGFRVVHDRRSAQTWTIFTLVVETGHLLFGLLMIVLMVVDVVAGHLGEALLTSVVNLGVNVYPVMLQRYTRGRLTRAFRLDLREMPTWEV